MTVSNQTPYVEYTANGSTTSFALTFDCDNANNLIVKINNVEAVGTWTLQGSTVVFITAPIANSIVSIERNTPLERTTNYQTYDDSFSPKPVNKDFDSIWWKLQELYYKLINKVSIKRKINTVGGLTGGGDLSSDLNISIENQNIEPKTYGSSIKIPVITVNEKGIITGISVADFARGGGSTIQVGFEDILNLPTTLLGYGITDALNKNSNLGDLQDKAVARTNLGVYSKAESSFFALPLGTPIWHNGTRLTIDDGYASYDGQLLNRADFPSLWAKVQSKFVVITDADWLADPKKRAAYSSGNGTTTFRMPDLNGFLADSIKGLHLRGDGNGTIAGETVLQSTILKDAIRDIQGTTLWMSYASAPEGKVNNVSGVSGAFYAGEAYANTLAGAAWQNSKSGGSYLPLNFKASNVVPTANENRPVSAVGIWVCRVSAGTAEQVLPNTTPSLTGGNTWAGSQSVQGNLTVSGKITGDIKPLLNATGEAPIYACRAWVNFNGVQLNGTYSQSGTTVTVTMTAHGMSVGQLVNLSITSGTALSGSYPVATVIDANTFTYTAGTSLTTTGNITRSTFIRGSRNVLGITDNGVGDYTVNFITAMPDTNYVINGTGSISNGNGASMGVQISEKILGLSSLLRTTSSCPIHSVSANGNSITDGFSVNVSFSGRSDSMNIIYKNQDGAVSVFTPTQEALDMLTLDEIAKRVVPTSVPYWIVDPSAIPTDRTFRDAWELDESQLGEPNGYGGAK